MGSKGAWVEPLTNKYTGFEVKEPPVRNPDFMDILGEMAAVHDKKSRDYAQDDNVYSNFEYAATISQAFTDPVDRVFATLIGVKLARLAELGKGKVPNNESVADSHMDLSVYTVIWAAYKRSKARGREL